MGKGVYVGVNNSSRKVKKIYVGVNGFSRKVKKIYVGADGVARLAWSGSVPAGQVIFTSSQSWTVPDGVSKVDVFLVGGGGKANFVGGGGGFTEFYPDVTVVPNTAYAVVVGAGGYTGNSQAANGGSSSFGVLSVGGGLGVYKDSSNLAGKGGSGGGAGYADSTWAVGGSGGSDGGNGGRAKHYRTGSELSSPAALPGQGYTTRAFKEAGGTLYAGGGGGFGYYFNYSSSGSQQQWSIGSGAGGAGGGGNGGSLDPDNYARRPYDGTPNTGGGAGGFSIMQSWNTTSYDVRGGSGIVIVRWKEQ